MIVSIFFFCQKLVSAWKKIQPPYFLTPYHEIYSIYTIHVHTLFKCELPQLVRLVTCWHFLLSCLSPRLTTQSLSFTQKLCWSQLQRRQLLASVCSASQMWISLCTLQLSHLIQKLDKSRFDHVEPQHSYKFPLVSPQPPPPKRQTSCLDWCVNFSVKKCTCVMFLHIDYKGYFFFSSHRHSRVLRGDLAAECATKCAKGKGRKREESAGGTFAATCCS